MLPFSRRALLRSGAIAATGLALTQRARSAGAQREVIGSLTIA